MDRRSFLRGLFALPCSVGLLARSLALQAGEAGSIPAPSTTPPPHVGVDYAASDSDQTSILMVDWRSPEELVAGFGSYDDFRAAEDDKFIAKFTEQLISNRNWLKESIRGN